ncbi:hypothetical protein Bca4012_011141 [Brassica carinata]
MVWRAKQASDLVQCDADKFGIATELQVDSVEGSDIKRRPGLLRVVLFSGVKENHQTLKTQEKIASPTFTENRSAPSEEAKARKKANSRKKRAQERISLGGTSDIPSANVMTSSTNISAASSNNKTVRDAIAQLRRFKQAFQAHLRYEFSLFRQNHTRGRTLKPSLGSKQKTQNSDKQSLKQSQQRWSVPLVPPKGISFLSYGSDEPASSRNVKTTLSEFFKGKKFLSSAMKLAAELESAKVERRTCDHAEAVNKGNVTVNKSVIRNSRNISSKILEFLSNFSHCSDWFVI